jgi:ribosomal-protein-alanine N-acetyltransferase
VQQAQCVITNYLFKQENFNRVEANVMPTNVSSIKILKQIGFEKEGFSKRYLKLNGIWQDHYRFALLNSNFKD